MGKVKNLISEVVLPERQHTYSTLWADLCENVHIHHKNVRLEFSVSEFLEFCETLQKFRKGVQSNLEGYKEGDHNYIKTFRPKPKNLSKRSKYFNNRFRIEEGLDGRIHIHYRDIRLELSPEEYDIMRKEMRPR